MLDRTSHVRSYCGQNFHVGARVPGDLVQFRRVRGSYDEDVPYATFTESPDDVFKYGSPSKRKGELGLPHAPAQSSGGDHGEEQQQPRFTTVFQ
jgi:hypothetical protein